MSVACTHSHGTVLFAPNKAQQHYFECWHDLTAVCRCLLHCSAPNCGQALISAVRQLVNQAALVDHCADTSCVLVRQLSKVVLVIINRSVRVRGPSLNRSIWLIADVAVGRLVCTNDAHLCALE